MTISTRLTFWFTGLASGLLLVFCVVLYVVAEQHREREFRERLREEALTSAELLFGHEASNPDLLKLLDKNNMTVLPNEEIIIYDQQNKLRYESGTDFLAVDTTTLNQVSSRAEVFWRKGDREIVGTVFNQRSNQFVVIASATDTYGFSKQRDLGWLLAVGWLGVTLLCFGVGRVFAQRSLKPLRQVIGRIDGITASKLDQRLALRDDQDELDQLSERFNQMLDRLEAAFRTQQAFVSHASHELRTPLTAITGQLDVALLTDESPDDLRASIRSVLDDVRGLNKLTNGLLSLAKIGIDTSAIQLAPVAVDALLWRVRDDIIRMHTDYQISIIPTDPPGAVPVDWHIMGSEQLLYTALLNLLENGGKFSPAHRVAVQLSQQPQGVQIRVHNDGLPIALTDMPHLFAPFRRGTNAQGVPGHGLGLSLVQRIILLHEGQIDVASTTEQGTIFWITLPRQASG